MRPAGVGKSFLGQALGYSAVRAGHTVRFSHADGFFKAMAQARVDNSVDRTFRSFLTPDLLILDDLGLHRLTAQQSADLYELILNRHRASSFVITSNRTVDEWLSLFDDPILGNSALDRLANARYQIVIEGASYRERLSPHRAFMGKGGDRPANSNLIIVKIATRPGWYKVLGDHWLNVHGVSQSPGSVGGAIPSQAGVPSLPRYVLWASTMTVTMPATIAC